MIENIVNRIDADLHKNFSRLDDWFMVSKDLVVYHPCEGSWNINEILEHISLTNHFLLILIRKGTLKAVERSRKNDFSKLLENYDLDWDKLQQVGQHKSFEWNRPEHMVPSGTGDMRDLKDKLHQQVQECRSYLNQLKNGEGVLCKTMMTVNSLGRIDVYHYIYFLSQHVKRHLEQMDKVKIEFENK